MSTQLLAKKADGTNENYIIFKTIVIFQRLWVSRYATCYPQLQHCVAYILSQSDFALKCLPKSKITSSLVQIFPIIPVRVRNQDQFPDFLSHHFCP